MLAPSRPPAPPDDLEALISEARARQRRRRLYAVAVVAALVAVALGISDVVVGPNSAQTHRPRPLTAVSPRCRSSQLHLSAYLVNVGAGNVTTGFTFTNTSPSPCTLHGWPTLRLVLSGGRVVDPHSRHVSVSAENGPLRVRTVALRPGGAASFDVGGINQIGRAGPLDRRCSAGSRAVLVTAPAARRPLRVAQVLTYCGPGSLSVYPVVPGRVDPQWRD